MTSDEDDTAISPENMLILLTSSAERLRGFEDMINAFVAETGLPDDDELLQAMRQLISQRICDLEIGELKQ